MVAETLSLHTIVSQKNSPLTKIKRKAPLEPVAYNKNQKRKPFNLQENLMKKK
jgi:hypothetical protein